MTGLPVKMQIDSISEFHKLLGVPRPENPLLSVINFEEVNWKLNTGDVSIIPDFYSIAYKKDSVTRCRYGQKEEKNVKSGGLHFISPKQVVTIEVSHHDIVRKGWMILIHPDFIWSTQLVNKIKQYNFFSYEINEALALSETESSAVMRMISNIAHETPNSADPLSKNVMIAHLELLLAYAERIYKKQFTIKKIQEHRILDQLETWIANYLKSDLQENGIPSIQYIARQLHVSPNYLSRLLQSLTGRSTKNYLSDKLIELAKERLSTTDLSVSEIAYEIGFKAPQSFSKLFKSRTNLTPLEFRQSFS